MGRRLAGGVLAALLVGALPALLRPSPADPLAIDRASLLDRIYREAARDLPADASVIGYVRVDADQVAGSRDFFLAQYALAPRLVQEDLSPVTWVLAGPGATAALDADPRLRGFALYAARGNGIRLYRHPPR